ncbi:MAG: hypothetical protein ACJAZO_001751 [Myxococcota bacterium]
MVEQSIVCECYRFGQSVVSGLPPFWTSQRLYRMATGGIIQVPPHSHLTEVDDAV